MASLWKHPNSPYWTACFTNETGKQVKKTTKCTDRRAALRMAEVWEEAAKKAKAAELTRAVAVKVLNELMERTHGEGFDDRSTRQHFEDYVAGLEARGTKGTSLRRYRPIFEGFLAHLGKARANARLASVSSQEIEAFCNAEIKVGKTAATASYALKVLNGVFEDARRKAIVLHNPVAEVLKRFAHSARAATEERLPFTDSQVEALLAVADNEWQGMILLAYHTGIRLTDAANLTQANLDGKLLRFRESKTAHRKQRASERETVVVMAADLLAYFKAQPLPLNKENPLFPSLHGKPPGSSGGLSNAFARLMEKAGLDRGKGKERQGKGRQFSALSFHSLRHTMISRLANSDVPEAIAKAMSGHSTDEAHRRYIHLDTEAQAKVVAKAPRLWQPAA
jgi:integrase